MKQFQLILFFIISLKMFNYYLLFYNNAKNFFIKKKIASKSRRKMNENFAKKITSF